MKKVSVGQTYGRLTVEKDSGERRHGQIMWMCRCACGGTALVHSRSLVRGATRSCGCLIREGMAARREDMTGQVFGRLTVTEPLRKRLWTCVCECGRVVAVHRSNLLRGKTRSCGCIRAERFMAMDTEREAGQIAHKSMQVDGTDISMIRDGRKLNRNSSTGVRGVSTCRNGRFRAYIGIKGKRIDLGTYGKIEEAAMARKSAENMHYKPVIDEWENCDKM